MNHAYTALISIGNLDSMDILKCTEYDECKCVEVKYGVLW